MKPLWILLTGITLLLAIAGGAWLLTQHAAPTAPPTSAQPPVAAAPGKASSRTETPVASTPLVPATISVPLQNEMPATNVLRGKPQTPPNSTTKSTPSKKRELLDPLARDALSLVGADPEAESYWLEAIYDTSLPDKEREDLMEDLNEDGLSDPKRPGPQDLPLILNRLAIIEELAPNADEFMLRHLGEAYKDLVNLAAVTQGGGQPVR